MPTCHRVRRPSLEYLAEHASGHGVLLPMGPVGRPYRACPFAVLELTIGLLIIGGTTVGYEEVIEWSSSTAGSMTECADYTEICIYDNNTRIASPTYYNGTFNQNWIGRDRGWFICSIEYYLCLYECNYCNKYFKYISYSNISQYSLKL